MAMTSEKTYELNTVKGHGLTVGDVVLFHGMGSDPLPTVEGTPVKFAGKIGTKYALITVDGEIMTWEFGPSAKVWISKPDHVVIIETHTLDNGDTIYVGKCGHGWMTGFHLTEQDARDVATGHGEVSRPLYVPPAPVAEVAPVDVYEAMVSTAQDAIKQNGRVFVAEAHNFGGLAAFDALVASGWATRVEDGDMSRYIRTMRTADRVEIIDGLPVWDYNLDAGRVDLSTAVGDGWFNVDIPGKPRSLMNGERVTTVHPFTRQTASDALADDAAPLDIPAPGEAEALQAEHDAAMSAWAAPLVSILTLPAPVVTEAEVWAGTGTVVTYPLTRPVRTNLNKRKRKATKVNARRVRGGF